MLERELEAWAKKRVSRRGALLLKWVSPGTAGVPDRILIGRNGVRFLEFKQAGKQATALQAAQMRRITEAGGICYVIDNKHAFDEVLAAVSERRDNAPV